MIYAIIAAGGKGKRFQNPISKQLCMLKGKPLLSWTLKPFQHEVDQIVLVYPADEHQADYQRVIDQEQMTRATLTKGGATRFESVRNGFHAIGDAADSDVVLVHDAARPLVSSALIRLVIKTATEKGSAIPVLPVSETLKEVEMNAVMRTVPRERLYIAQTPQGFRYEVLRKAYANARQERFTDESGLVESSGFKVAVVPGERHNIKITETADVTLAEHYLQESWK